MADQAPDPPKSRPSNTNHYILAALGGTLAATVVVIIISLILSPAHITFSVVHAARKVSADRNNQTVLTVTVAANNTSHRCKAKYEGIFVDLKNSTNTAGKSSIHAGVQGMEFPTGYIKGPSVTLVTASVALVGNADTAEAMSFATRANDTGLTAEVRALVSFKIGVAPTRSYEITVFCPGVVFRDEDDSNSSAQQRSFNCTG